MNCVLLRSHGIPSSPLKWHLVYDQDVSYAMQQGELVSSNDLWNRTETRIRIEDRGSAREVPQALALIRRPDFLSRRTLWHSQQHIVLRKQRTTGHDVQMFDRDWGIVAVGDAMARVLRR